MCVCGGGRSHSVCVCGVCVGGRSHSVCVCVWCVCGGGAVIVCV